MRLCFMFHDELCEEEGEGRLDVRVLRLFSLRQIYYNDFGEEKIYCVAIVLSS